MSRDPDKNWCHRYTRIKVFWSQPMIPWTHRPLVPSFTSVVDKTRYFPLAPVFLFLESSVGISRVLIVCCIPCFQILVVVHCFIPPPVPFIYIFGNTKKNPNQFRWFYFSVNSLISSSISIIIQISVFVIISNNKYDKEQIV